MQNVRRVEQREDLRRATEAYRKSLAVYEALAAAGQLAAVHASKPAEIGQALGEAEAALQAGPRTRKARATRQQPTALLAAF